MAETESRESRSLNVALGIVDTAQGTLEQIRTSGDEYATSAQELLAVALSQVLTELESMGEVQTPDEPDYQTALADLDGQEFPDFDGTAPVYGTLTAPPTYAPGTFAPSNTARYDEPDLLGGEQPRSLVSTPAAYTPIFGMTPVVDADGVKPAPYANFGTGTAPTVPTLISDGSAIELGDLTIDDFSIDAYDPGAETLTDTTRPEITALTVATPAPVEPFAITAVQPVVGTLVDSGDLILGAEPASPGGLTVPDLPVTAHSVAAGISIVNTAPAVTELVVPALPAPAGVGPISSPGFTMPTPDTRLPSVRLDVVAPSFSVPVTKHAPTAFAVTTLESLTPILSMSAPVWDSLWSISEDIFETLRANAVADIKRQELAELREANAHHASLGWDMPGVSMFALRATALNKSREGVGKVTSEKFMKRAEMRHEDYWKVVSSALEVSKINLQAHMETEKLNLQAHSDYMNQLVQIEVGIANERVGLFNAAVDQYKATISALTEIQTKAGELELQGELGQVTAWTAEVNAQVQAYVAEANAQASFYSAQASAVSQGYVAQYNALTQGYSAEVDGKTKIFSAEEGAKAQAYSAEYDARTKTYVAKAGADASAYTAEIEADVRVYEVTSSSKTAEYTANVNADINAYTAKTDAEAKTYVALVNAEAGAYTAKVGGISSQYTAEAGAKSQVHTAETNAKVGNYSAYVDALTKVFVANKNASSLAYKTDAEVQTASFTAGANAKVQVYSAEAEAAMKQADSLLSYDRNLMEMYKAEWSGVTAKAQAYAAYVDGLRAYASAQQSVVAAFGETVNAEKAKVDAHVAQWQGFAAGFEGWRVRAELVKADASMVGAASQRYQSDVQKDIAITDGNKAVFESGIEDYKAQSQAWLSQADHAVKTISTQAEIYKADASSHMSVLGGRAEGLKAKAAILAAALQAYAATADTSIREHESNTKKAVAKADALAKMGTIATQVYAQLAASAYSAMNYSVSGSGSVSAGYSASNSFGISVGADADSDYSDDVHPF